MAHLNIAQAPPLTFTVERVFPNKGQAVIVRVNGIASERHFYGPHGNLYMIEHLAGDNLAVCRTSTIKDF